MIQSLTAFIGRALLSLIFVSSAINKILDWQGTLHYFNQVLTDWVAACVGTGSIQAGLEWSLANSSMILLVAVIMELVGGVCVFLGLWTRFGALLLILFMICATILFHHFWTLQGAERQMEMISFMKNVTITGGLLFVLAVGKGTRPSSKTPDKPG